MAVVWPPSSTCCPDSWLALQEVKTLSDAGRQHSHGVTSCMEAGNLSDLTLGSADSSTASPGAPLPGQVSHGMPSTAW